MRTLVPHIYSFFQCAELNSAFKCKTEGKGGLTYETEGGGYETKAGGL